ncbi:hypothetical protein JZ751_006955 [Albula glossodonta]|uniref:SPIN-DOC-like zinc-finger domain-containing protein n=1 Tax=Albula glossodonta TaxID=121402 RepID=A0A8T2P2F7_9TELE|nr:hypothetical protein JZ751_006955 [Albula glossodonta]
MDSMQNSSSLRTQRYRPASEFDEATLVRKREYWRIKKREQRAKLSLLKKERLTAANTRTCKSRASSRHLTGEENRPIPVPLAVPAPTLLNSDGTYQTGSQPKKSSHQVGTEKNANPPSVLCSEQSTAVLKKKWLRWMLSQASSVPQQEMMSLYSPQKGITVPRVPGPNPLTSSVIMHIPLPRLRTKRIGHNCCSPEPPKQLETATPQPDDDLLRKKREYWRIAKREQRAKKAAREKEMRRQGERGRQQIARATQGATVCVVKTHKAESQNEGHNLHSSPALQTTNSTPILLSSAPGTLTCIKGVTTLPVLKVVNSTPVIPGHCSGTLKSKIPAKDPMGTSVRQLVADSQVSFNCSNLPFPTGGNSLDAAMSGGIKNTGQLLLMESQQNTPLGSSPESSQVKCWRLQVKHSADIPSSQSASTSKNTSLVHSQAPPSYNIPLRAKQKDACKPLESPKQTQTPEQLEEDLLRKKREYWRVKKKEQRARKAAREREMKRQGATGGWRPILPAKEASRSLEPEGQVSRQWFNSELKDSELLPSASSEAEFSVLPQLCPPGAVKDELQIDLEADHEEDEEEEDGHSDSPLSEAAWRTRFLMDFDPLNQLLVCMVCGELQHSHSLETVRGHIEEAHPDTLSMDPQDRRRILEAWDEQVFLRERFFSNQLQQHSSTLTGESQESPAEVEVLVDLEESPALKNGKASKTKSPKKL